VTGADRMRTANAHLAIEDLVDFYKRWPGLRDIAVDLQSDAQLAQDQQAILEWMVLVIDRVGPADLERK
jgi:hypothetical protein